MKQVPIRFPDSLTKQGKKRAKHLGLTFSAYVRYLLTADINSTTTPRASK